MEGGGGVIKPLKIRFWCSASSAFATTVVVPRTADGPLKLLWDQQKWTDQVVT